MNLRIPSGPYWSGKVFYRKTNNPAFMLSKYSLNWRSYVRTNK
jgi:hypothetical protein